LEKIERIKKKCIFKKIECFLNNDIFINFLFKGKFFIIRIIRFGYFKIKPFLTHNITFVYINKYIFFIFR